MKTSSNIEAIRGQSPPTSRGSTRSRKLGERVLRLLSHHAPGVKKGVFHAWYQLVNGSIDPLHEDTHFLNYGYAPMDKSLPGPGPVAEGNRYPMMLYNRVAAAVDLSHRDVLEVGSGRGGGAAFVMESLGPRSVTGVDFSKRAVEFCNDRHRMEGLTFIHGDAESLPFDDGSFDAVLNVESSHCYGLMDRFLGEVVRVLRPGGHFLFADMRYQHQVDMLRDQILGAGLAIVEEERITPNVVRALELDHDRKLALIRENTPRVLLRTMKNFAGAKGSRIFESLWDGHVEYLRYVAVK